MKANNLVKILLVDDRPENLFALEVMLSDENYTCVKAKSGKEALKILNREQDFVIILMDVQMPRMDGFETVELIRQITNLKHLPIIFLTASMDNAVHIFKGYQSGAVDYMIKPLSPEILKAKVAVLVELYKKKHQLLVQNEEKVKREAELLIANKELIFQNEEKEKRAAELLIANKELNQSEELLRNSLKEISDYKYALDVSTIIAITDQQGIIKKVNNNFCKISKYSEAELIGQSHSIINSGYHPKEFIQNLWTTIANGEIWKGEIKNKAKDGTFYWVDTTIIPFLNEHGKPYQYLSIRSDITNRKEAEEDLIQRTFQLKTVNKELAFQNDEKEKRAAELIIANKELLAFNYVSSHDLQEPLRKIQIFTTTILETENLSDKGKNNFQRILLSAGRMRQLIEDLLAFSQINTAERKFEKIDLNIIIDEVKTELKNIIDEKHATIVVTEICPANIIAFQFRQLMLNLLSNALKFSQPDIPPHISIKSKTVSGSKLNIERLSPEKDYCHITVKDKGIGFEPRFNERIFEVFQKLHRQEVYTGTGIGLAIVKKIVENHNGIIVATGELKKGATFDIYIPAD